MKIKNILLLAAAVAAATTLLLIPTVVAQNREPQIPVIPVPTLTHAQEVWISALEWCESRGVESAINPKDRDGTPSYGSFQFKPSTLIYFANKYGISTTTVMDTAVQHKVLEAMVLDSQHIVWAQQFPDCVLHKVGLPPKS